MVLDDLKLFCDVAGHRSFSRGAAAAGLTQSAVSQRIMGLERELGVRLIDRSTRPLRLTAAGQTYYQGCVQIVDQYERMCAQLNGGAAELRGEVAIAAIYSAGIDLLNRIKSDFEAANPQTTLQIDYVQPQAVYERVRRAECDFGILSYPDSWRGLTSMPLREETMVVVCCAGHALAGRAELDAPELAGRPMVGFDDDLPISRQIARYLKDEGVDASVVNSFDNIDTIKGYVADSDAVAILPQRTVQREVKRGMLAAVALRPQLVRPIGVVYPRLSELRPLAKRVVEYLLNHQPAEAANTSTAER